MVCIVIPWFKRQVVFDALSVEFHNSSEFLFRGSLKEEVSLDSVESRFVLLFVVKVGSAGKCNIIVIGICLDNMG